MKQKSCILVLLVLFSLFPACKKGSVTLKYANFPPATTFPCIQMERWKREIEKRTGGSVVVETYPDGKLLSALNMLEGIASGKADIGCLCVSYQPEKFPFSNVMSLPLGIPNSLSGSGAFLELSTKYKPKELNDVKVIAMFTTPPSNIMSIKPILTLGDLAGKSIRASGGMAAILKAWGANPVDLPMPSTTRALSREAIYGLFSSLDVMKDLDLAKYCPYVTMTASAVYPFVVVMNKKTWDGLPADVRKTIDDMIVEQTEWAGRYLDSHVDETIKWSEKNFKVRFLQQSEGEKALWSSKLAHLTAAWKEEARKNGYDTDAILKDVRLYLTNQAK